MPLIDNSAPLIQINTTVTETTELGVTTVVTETTQESMTLRQYYAGQAMQHQMARLNQGAVWSEDEVLRMSQRCVMAADCMLIALAGEEG